METLFVGNLPYDATAAELGRWFKTSGVEVDTVSLQFDRLTGRSRGFAYVSVLTGRAKAVVSKCNGQPFGGRTLVVGQRPESSDRPNEEVTSLSCGF